MAIATSDQPVLSERVRRLRDGIAHQPRPLSTERLQILKEAYQETEGMPAILRRARLFEKVLHQKTIYIDDNPLVGSITDRRAGVHPLPEWSCRWMRKEVEFSSDLGRIPFTLADQQAVHEAVEYWQDKCVHTRAKETAKQLYQGRVNPDWLGKAGVCTEHIVSQPMGAVNLDYEKVINRGVVGVINEVREELRRLPIETLESHSRRHFLNAAVICLEAVVAYAARHAALARAMAQGEADVEMRRELEQIADVCERVPAHPARSFREAIQSFWFTHVCALIETQTMAIVPGRIGQYMYPLYRKDRDEATLTEDGAIELLQFLFIKIFEHGVFRSGIDMMGGSGQTNQHITLGGLTAAGEDATTELDWLLLETQRRVRCPQPTLSVLFHDKLSPEFLLKCVEVIRDTGMGQPAFFSNTVAMQKLLYYHPGMSLEEARSVTMCGCVGNKIPHAFDGVWGGILNMTKPLELALNNGRDPLTGFQVGLETGDVDSFQSYEDLCDAVRKQLEYLETVMRELNHISYCIMAEMLPLPYQSTLIDDCIKRGKDLLNGGTRYSRDAATAVGGVDLANSLAAIRKLVFEDRRLTLRDLKRALAANFEGEPSSQIQRWCLEAPKFGNDNDYVDKIAREWYDRFWEIDQRTSDHLGRKPRPEIFSISLHNPLGRRTGALPTGRKARLPLTDASVSAMPGTDRNGPTALAKSAARAIDTLKMSNHLNMKFHPSALGSKDGVLKLLALTKTYMDLGGHHIQFNVVSSDTLRQAQARPDDYRDLLVRVAGFSAFFIHLDRAVQDEVIARTEFRW